MKRVVISLNLVNFSLKIYRILILFCHLSVSQKVKIGREPWHISYLPLAEQASRLFTPDVLLQVWQHETVAGKETLIAHLPEIFEQYVVLTKTQQVAAFLWVD